VLVTFGPEIRRFWKYCYQTLVSDSPEFLISAVISVPSVSEITTTPTAMSYFLFYKLRQNQRGHTFFKLQSGNAHSKCHEHRCRPEVRVLWSQSNMKSRVEVTKKKKSERARTIIRRLNAPGWRPAFHLMHCRRSNLQRWYKKKARN
jgi:hypothetical protein